MQPARLRLFPLLSASLVLLVSLTARAEFQIYLKEPNKIPLYAQQTSYWCGAGAGQMVLEGFPDDVNHSYTQRTVWDEIQEHKVESGWYSDPDGLRGALMQLGKGSRWEATCAKTRDAITRLTIDGMYLGKYPVPVLVYGHDHWVVVIGATLETHPMLSMTVTLKSVEAHDPWNAQHVLIDGDTWLKKYWDEKGTSGKWRNCYVAVHEVETPLKSVLAETRLTTEEHPTDGSPIPASAAREKAKEYLDRITSDRSAFRALSRGTLGEPILVTHHRGNYYLVPIEEKKNGLSVGALLVNAYSGEWEGISKFNEPLHYRAYRDAGRWVFQPSQQSPSPFHPVYQTARGFKDLTGKFSEQLNGLGRGN